MLFGLAAGAVDLDLLLGDAALERQGRFSEIVGQSPEMQRFLRQLERVAATDLTVLVTGESGTGKELVAKALFAHGPRKERPFVSVNCGALNDNLLESELFGHVRGSFTGADRDKEGLFQLANGGTLFLDEVGDTSLSMQVKLLRALQEGEVRKVGAKDAVRVDVRVVAATNRDLTQMMREGKFREDLYYRLNVVALQLPALRERSEDVPLLCLKLLAELPHRNGRAWRLAPDAVTLLTRYPWPGNIRELRATLHNAAIFAESEVLSAADFAHKPELRSAPSRPMNADLAGRSMEELELEAIRRTLEMTKNNKSETARLLGIDRKTLYNKLKRLEAEGHRFN
jgi:two-component system response regulator HydG